MINKRRNIALLLEDAPAVSEASSTGLSKAIVPLLLEMAPHVSATVIVQTHAWIPPTDVLKIKARKYYLAGRLHHWIARLNARMKGIGSIKLAQLHGMLIGRKLRVMLDRELSPSVIWSPIGVDLLSLIRLDTAARIADRPFEVYLVDDIENHPSNNGVKNANLIIENILRRASRIYTITPDLGSVVSNRYGVKTLHLPLATECPIEKEVFAKKEKYFSAYLGSINHLYEDGIRLLIQYTALLRERTGQDLRVRLISSSSDVIKLFGGKEQVPEWVHHGQVSGNLGEVLAGSKFCFLPYSFEDSAKIMTSTSYPSKLIDYFGWARLIVIYGPRDSVPYRIFKRLGLDFITDDANDLFSFLEGLTQEVVDNNALYRSALKDEHDAKRVVSVLFQ